MQTKFQVETEFRAELCSLLKKYNATLEAIDVFWGIQSLVRIFA